MSDGIISIESLFTDASQHLLEIASGKVFPSMSINARGSLIDDKSTSFANLDEIDFYVTRSELKNLELPSVSFDTDTDEVQYLSHIMFQNIIMKEFQNQHSGLSSDLGDSLKPNEEILRMSDGINTVESIYNDHQDFFNSYMVEYISSILQSKYSKMKDVPVNDRLAYNSWDMIKANSRIDLIEKGEDFKKIINKLYSLATSYCQNGVLDPYKESAEYWADELITYYSDDVVIASIISDFQVQEYSNTSFKKAMKMVNNTINKVRALNVSSGYFIDEDTINEFDKKLFGCVFSGFAVSMNWGSQSDENSVLWNKRNFNDAVKILRDESEGQTSFWNDFFDENPPEQFWSELNDLGLKDNKIQDQDAYEKIINKYPDLGTSTRSSYDTYLATFSFLLSVGHFTWATTTGREEGDSPLPLMSLGAAFIETVLSYEIVAQKIAIFIIGNVDEIIVNNMTKFSQFISNLCTKGRTVKNAARAVTETLFTSSLTNITKVIDICFVALSTFAAAIASYDLAQAIISGDTADIIFASINLLVAGAGVATSIAAAMGAAAAGPIGIVIAIVGIVIAIAQWIYELLQKPEPPLSPIQKYTNEIIKPNGLIHKNPGSFLCKAASYWNGSMVCTFNTQTMNTDWDNISHIVDRGDGALYTQPHALVTSSRTSRIYNFANINKATYCKISDFFTNGTNIDISGWSVPYDIEICKSAVESVSSSGAVSAIFLAAKNKTSSPKLYMTESLENAPQNEFSGISTEYRESIYDVIAINGLPECTFLVFTNFSIYQINGRVVKKVIESYDLGDNPSFAILNAFITGDIVNVVYDLSGDDYFYHYSLTRDSAGYYTQFNMLGARDRIVGPSPVVGVYFNDDDENYRISFMSAGNNLYKRYGAIIPKLKDKNEILLNLYGGVEFTVPDNGFYCFYKNAFIPS
ncbi:hypothetical protein M5U04_15965 [Xenorhabdus sp. XENO-1]|uniref:hypothetical protein n=1 Tax=Xenorhabdus bovienii TaxID=40576 RepID=UPI0020CA4744|nr:hypothetical protein [Xenorhabdus bovienii]MCP9269542.1 hypothetical protein [Xenorhabdus bovienii subsp. africana]